MHNPCFCLFYSWQWFNSLRPDADICVCEHGHHCLTHWGRDKMAAISPTTTTKRIFLNEDVRISIKISLKFVPKGPINNIPALDQIMAWRRPGDKPLSERIMVRLLTHICITRPQWIKVMAVPYSVPSSCLSQCWPIVNWTLGIKFSKV